MPDYPKSVRINEEGPREGVQSETAIIPTVRKIELIDALSETGLPQIQVGSFVNPKAVPGMADIDDVVRGFKRAPEVRYTALWLNEKGLQRAIAAKRIDIRGSISLTASEKFLLRNQKRSLAENLASQHNVIAMYRQHGIVIDRASIMAAFGCNFEGDIAYSRIFELLGQIMELSEQYQFKIKTLSLADTMAWATPDSVRRLVAAIRERQPDLEIALHLHNTRGLGVANAYAGLEMGVAVFDAAVGGLGGCPFSGHRGAAGNVCTEDLVFLCDELGIDTGVDLDALIRSARLAEDIFGHELPGSVMKGGSLSSWRAKITETRH